MGFPDITYQLILPLLQKIAELTHSYGWAIIVLTIAFRLLVSPLVAQTTISMRRMSKLQPQMKAIQERYKGDPEQLQKKLVEFYSKNKVNPVGGCLPTLIQLPILFALYAAFAGPPFTDKMIDVKVNVVKQSESKSFSKDEASGGNSIYLSKDGVPAKVVVFPGNCTIASGTDLNFGMRTIEGKLPSDFKPDWKIVLPDHKVKEATEIKKDNAATAGENEAVYKSEEIVSKDSPDQAAVKEEKDAAKQDEAYINSAGHAFFTEPGEYHIQGIVPGIAKGEPFAFISGLGKVATGASLLKPANYDIVFLILMFGLTMFMSQKLTVPTPKPADGQELDEQQIIQQQTMKTMPLVTTAMFFFFPIPAGVYLYLVLSNIIQTFQTWLITRMPEPDFNDGETTITVVEKDKSENNGNGHSSTKPNKSATSSPRANAKQNGGKGSSTKNGQTKKKSKRKKT